MPTLDELVIGGGLASWLVLVAMVVREIVRRDIAPEIRYRRAWRDFERGERR